MVRFMGGFGTKITFSSIVLFAVPVAAVVLAFLYLGLFVHAVPQGSVDLVAIDMDTTGNNDTNVGTIQNCAAIPNVGVHNQFPAADGTTQILDLVVKGVDAADKLAGYQFDIDYNPAVIEIIGAKAVDGTPTDEALGGIPNGTVTMISRINTWGGAGFISTSEPALPFSNLADTDGSYTVAAADGTNQIAAGTHPPAGHESGDGVLARVTVRSVGAGTSPLTIPWVIVEVQNTNRVAVCFPDL